MGLIDAIRRKLRGREKEQAPAYPDYAVGSGLGVANPDDLVDRKGLAIYRKMGDHDADIASHLELVAHGVLSPGWEVVAPPESPKQTQEAAEFVTECFRLLGGERPDRSAYYTSTDEVLLGMITDAWQYGVHVSELVLLEEDGRIWLDALKSKDPLTVALEVDRFGNLAPNGVGVTTGGGQPTWYPLQRFVVWSLAQQYGNPWGRSKLRAVYRDYYLMDVALRALAIISQRYAGGAVVGRYPAHDKGLKSALLTKLKQLQREGVMVVPEGVEVTVQELVSQSVKVLPEIIAQCQARISRRLTFQVLATAEAKFGSRAQAETQATMTKELLIRATDRMLCSVLNVQVVRRVCDWNFNTASPEWVYPEFRFLARDKEDYEVLSRVHTRLWNMGAWLDAEQVYQAYNLTRPEGAPDIISKEHALRALWETVPEGAVQAPRMPKPPIPPQPGGKTPASVPDGVGQAAEDRHARTLAKDRGADEARKTAALGFESYKPRRYMTHVDALAMRGLEEREKWGDVLEQRLREMVQKNMDRWRKEPQAINEIGPLPGWEPFRRKIRSLWREAWVYGHKTALDEVREAEKRHGASLAEEADPEDWSEADFDRMMDGWEARDLADVRKMMRDAAKAGWPPETIMERFGAWWEKRKHDAETNMHTEFSRAFNAARRDVYRTSRSVRGVAYDVVVDDRTTEDICLPLANHPPFRLEDAPGTPPFHYRCRTVERPVFVWEDVTWAKEPPAGWQPQEGFYDEGVDFGGGV